VSLSGFAYNRAALDALAQLPKKVRRQIRQKVEALAANLDATPQNTKRLLRSDPEKPIYRLRSGDYRILYIVQNSSEIVVLEIGHRKDIYR